MYVSSLFISLSYLLSLRSISSAPVPQYSLIFNPILDFSPAFEPTVDWNCLQDLYLAGQLATASLSGCTNNEGSESKGLRIAFGNDKNPFASINRLLELKKQQASMLIQIASLIRARHQNLLMRN
ncbi:hypothetical protein K7432_010146 [Basidiobolus ranarum]|uniref:Uncharacterized protein n=1 Tax=Basidiobolus ranarum TaxID=34480 RepID=A0ABR2VWV3_9FUNG